ncbi:penicillin-binding protein [Candidatus Neomarinimicrobiota bacterium]
MSRLYVEYRPRVIALNIIVTVLLLTVVGKLFHIQILGHNKYHSRAIRQSTNIEVLPSIRGNIKDRNGELLTSNTIHYSFAADPEFLMKSDSVVDLFVDTFHKPANYYHSRLSTERSFVWLERNISSEQSGPILERSFQGLIVRKATRRKYPYGHIPAPLIGFTDIDGGGIAGLELEYDTFLRGENGRQVLRHDAKGRVLPISSQKIRAPRDGASLHLTIDATYQSILQEEMARATKRLASVAIHGVLIEPNTGAVLAMAQYPSFDPNHPAATAASNQRVRAITDMYEPGSTLKVVTATAAIDAGITSITDIYDCEEGEFDYYNLKVQDTYPKGILTFKEIIAHSSNIGIIKVAEMLGRDLLYKYCNRFGLGTRTGISLPGETPGILREPTDWSAVSVGEIAMGQEIGVTTLQLALLYGAIANGGRLMRPLLITRIVGPDGKILVNNHPQAIRRVASESTMEQVRQMLLYAIQAGTGSDARLPGYSMAGKTGTAQKFVDGKYSNTEFMATFAAMFPAEEPKLVCVVAVDNPRYGSHFGAEAAAPIVRNTFKRILNLDEEFYIPQQPEPQKSGQTADQPYLLISAGQLPPPHKPGVVPDFRGYSMRKSIELARKTGVQLQIEGSGIVISQSTKPGTRVNRENICRITLSDNNTSW